ncbi:MAG: peptidoglycan DD-metalloendopeptidase family protein [Clostridia bacterium]|nr:peptidoglycan DD-metalloendopeptidase family protein [Clostridia bacterium]
MDLGKTIKQLRTQRNLTQAELAEQIGVHYQSVSKWERNLVMPDLALIDVLAKFFDVTVEQLIDYDGTHQSVTGTFDASKIGGCLAQLRKSCGKSQGEVAQIAQVSSNIVSKWERGVICPGISTIVTLSQAFDVSPSSIYYAKLPTANQTKACSSANGKKRLAFLSILVLLVVAATITLCVLLPPADVPTPQTNYKPPIAEAKVLSQHSNEYYNPVIAATEYQRGFDLCAKVGQKVYAMSSGTVLSIYVAEQDLEYNGLIAIRSDDGVLIEYGYVAPSQTLKVGDVVQAGQEIGVVVNNDAGTEYSLTTHLHLLVTGNQSVLQYDEFLRTQYLDAKLYSNAPIIAKNSLCLPVNGGKLLTKDQQFVHESLTNSYFNHNGFDVSAQVGQSVYAVLSGVVTEVTSDDYYGPQIFVTCKDGTLLTYCFVSTNLKVGDKVAMGDVIGKIVSSNDLMESHLDAHLHIAVTGNMTQAIYSCFEQNFIK